MKDFFSKCEQIRSRIWLHLLKKALIENVKIFRAFVYKHVSYKKRVHVIF